MDLKSKIAVIEDYPQPGISFKDITTLFKDGEAYCYAIKAIADYFRGKPIDLVVGPEARGFLVGAPVAYELGVGFVPVRKPGKLPGKVVDYTYTLEYGQDTLEIKEDAIKPGMKILIVDDLLATGGTISAVVNLVEKLGGEVIGCGFLIELCELAGRKKLPNNNAVMSLVQY